MNGSWNRMKGGRVARSAMLVAFLAAVAAVHPADALAQGRVRAQPPVASGSVDNDDRPQRNQTRPLPDIVARVQATPPFSSMDYIGVAGFETRSMVYILRFLDGRQVVVVHVDARSGRIIGRQP